MVEVDVVDVESLSGGQVTQAGPGADATELVAPTGGADGLGGVREPEGVAIEQFEAVGVVEDAGIFAPGGPSSWPTPTSL